MAQDFENTDRIDPAAEANTVAGRIVYLAFVIP
jgi:hypothetical protein